ncbi:MAG: BMP family ABC transporter substrate-binding protein [Chloroflexi bacterium]|nr:BMP family ABC transporter substrate-binding protein [Chloroflexota bacterium]
MVRKTLLFLVVASLIAFTVSACAPAAKPKVALMLARGGLGDKAFNDSANEGLQKAAQDLGADVMTFDYQQDAQEQNVRAAAEAGYGLVIGLGSENSAAIATVAAKFPATRFAIVDATAEGANIASVTFSELEGDFLAGALAALLSADGKVGYLGGADVTVIRRIQFGFEQGVKYVNPDAEIVVKYIAGKDDFSGFAKPDEAKAIAAGMYADGVSIVYAAAGGSTLGAIDAAKSATRLIVTTGSDQRWIAPEAVVTSRTKNMNQAVFHLIQSFAQGKLSAGVIQLDYKSGGIGLAPLAVNLVPADILTQFEQIRSDLEAGKIELNPFTGN